MNVTIKFSVDSDQGGVLTGILGRILTDAGLVRTGNTATYSGQLVENALGDLQLEFWTAAAIHDGPGRIDHVWMYINKDYLQAEEAQAAE
ncbi:hypothetical protein CCR97_22465 [Rhodoplanes elegans]|uniref:Uncharacterized protein n=1 Tax=Rhodoplanes elegans TaxID=29408 RepID=A0A327K2B6_9BRAD|nr:hypothetical protein [Rhodoplanes elegans]MBK5960946.1 hypothetical protein [Rhodoplanes elegans]RAI32421.1 hypothetical protein CH338_24175 [Rhodoplanes elegans]